MENWDNPTSLEEGDNTEHGMSIVSCKDYSDNCLIEIRVKFPLEAMAKVAGLPHFTIQKMQDLIIDNEMKFEVNPNKLINSYMVCSKYQEKEYNKYLEVELLS